MSEIRRTKPLPLFWWIAVAILVPDQLSKLWIEHAMVPGESWRLIGDWFRFTSVRNDGIAMGLLQGQNNVLLVVVGAILVSSFFWAKKVPWALREMNVLGGLILGGALGNLIDRVRVGHVIDFIDVTIFSFRWWTFNVADSAISVAVVWILIRSWSPSFGRLETETLQK
jgi:signal peptidase II